MINDSKGEAWEWVRVPKQGRIKFVRCEWRKKLCKRKVRRMRDQPHLLRPVDYRDRSVNASKVLAMLLRPC